jgi:hypothetical protein
MSRIENSDWMNDIQGPSVELGRNAPAHLGIKFIGGGTQNFVQIPNPTGENTVEDLCKSRNITLPAPFFEVYELQVNESYYDYIQRINLIHGVTDGHTH